jgi:hypothetical protein
MRKSHGIKIKDIGPREFIRFYGLRLPTIQSTRLGMLLACGDDLKQAVRTLGFTDEVEVVGALGALERIGFIERDLQDEDTGIPA